MPIPAAAPEQARADLRDGGWLWTHSMAATPLRLLEGLKARALERRGLNLMQLHTEGPALLAPGAGVLTTRAHAQYVVTEYGIANLRGRSLRERAQALIAIAHPDFREALERAARETWGLAW